MITKEKRIHELTTRQVFYGSSLVCKLRAVRGKFYYDIYVWNDNTKFIYQTGKYNGEDPLDLFIQVESEIGRRKEAVRLA